MALARVSVLLVSLFSFLFRIHARENSLDLFQCQTVRPVAGDNSILTDLSADRRRKDELSVEDHGDGLVDLRCRQLAHLLGARIGEDDCNGVAAVWTLPRLSALNVARGKTRRGIDPNRAPFYFHFLPPRYSI